jgi:hypothetical protein
VGGGQNLESKEFTNKIFETKNLARASCGSALSLLAPIFSVAIRKGIL